MRLCAEVDRSRFQNALLYKRGALPGSKSELSRSLEKSISEELTNTEPHNSRHRDEGNRYFGCLLWLNKCNGKWSVLAFCFLFFFFAVGGRCIRTAGSRERAGLIGKTTIATDPPFFVRSSTTTRSSSLARSCLTTTPHSWAGSTGSEPQRDPCKCTARWPWMEAATLSFHVPPFAKTTSEACRSQTFSSKRTAFCSGTRTKTEASPTHCWSSCHRMPAGEWSSQWWKIATPAIKDPSTFRTLGRTYILVFFPGATPGWVPQLFTCVLFESLRLSRLFVNATPFLPADPPTPPPPPPRWHEFWTKSWKCGSAHPTKCHFSFLKARNTQGFLSNGQSVTFRNCDANPNSYFVFFPNHKEKTPSPYHGSNLVYERSGVAVNWRRTGRKMPSHRTMPNDFIFLTELHFGGCGTYTSSDRWREARGAAIGLRWAGRWAGRWAAKPRAQLQQSHYYLVVISVQWSWNTWNKIQMKCHDGDL